MSLSNTIQNQTQKSFQFKSSFSQCIVFEILRNDIDDIERSLSEMTHAIAQFFSNSPIIIDLEKIKSTGEINFEFLKKLLFSYHLLAFGVRGGSEAQQAAALFHGLPTIKQNKSPSQTATNDSTAALPSKLITQPIRSGMQVYAKGSDLIVTSQVSAGAELMADGHIHVYGTLRGRVLAGVRGNKEARIFCQQLDVELIAIAGLYLTRDEIQLPEIRIKPLQIFLQNEQLHIETI